MRRPEGCGRGPGSAWAAGGAGGRGPETPPGGLAVQGLPDPPPPHPHPRLRLCAQPPSSGLRGLPVGGTGPRPGPLCTRLCWAARPLGDSPEGSPSAPLTSLWLPPWSPQSCLPPPGSHLRAGLRRPASVRRPSQQSPSGAGAREQLDGLAELSAEAAGGPVLVRLLSPSAQPLPAAPPGVSRGLAGPQAPHTCRPQATVPPAGLGGEEHAPVCCPPTTWG